MSLARYGIEWASGGETLVALEPTPDEVTLHAPALAAAYSEPHNRAMMAHSGDMAPGEVVEHYASMAAEGARPLLLFRGDALAGDADLRHVEGGFAEAAILVAARSAQGKGLGTRFGLMMHALAFRTLELERVYATIIPANTASLRLFEKLGYRRDASAKARSYIDEDSDVSLSLGRDDFLRDNPLPDVIVRAR